MKRLITALAAMLALGFVLPAASHWAVYRTDGLRWYEASREVTGLAPNAVSERGAVVQVYAARTFGWRGAFAVHTWITWKPANASGYERYDVVGWGGGQVVRRNYAAPDAKWYGKSPNILVDVRGEKAALLIPKLQQAVASYPWPNTYKSFPGPNSNTFIAHIGRSVPELGLNLPPTAIGKDYRGPLDPVGRPPSGQGVQASVLGLLGVTASPVEGVEVNFLGLSTGLDIEGPSIRLPGWGRIGSDR